MVKQSIGDLVSLEGVHAAIKPIINDIGQFIEQGGLLTLSNAYNQEEILALIENVHLENLPEHVFDGLFLRNTDDIPAFKVCLKSPNLKILQFTNKLIDAYKRLYPAAESKLNELVLEVSKPPPPPPSAQPEFIEPISQLKPVDLPALPNLPPKSRIPESLMRTWQNQAAPLTDVLSYCQELVRPGSLKKRLIKCISDEQV